MLFDTNFLISYQRGSKLASKKQCEAFLELLQDSPLFIAKVTWTEFIAGCATVDAGKPYLESFTLIEMENALWWRTSRLIRELAAKGKKIGLADSIIAATALAYGLPLVTNNTRHFREVDGLQIVNF